jgi:hypothetical protein
VNIYSTVKNSYFNVLICLSFDINQIHISNFLICHAVEVATPDANTVGICLPPLHVGQVGAPAWQSETDLLSSLLKTTSVAHALKVFNAHRTSFVTEDDLRRISQDYGVYRVRVPLSWCFTDADPETDIRTEDHMTTAMKEEYEKDLLEKFTCQDPYYEDVRWPAIPRRLLVQFLRSCAKFGIEASLDLHTYPGATSPGTFSGLWPRPPRFWLHDDPASPHQDYGRQLFLEFVQWVENLDDEALRGVLGISPMNEPAHLAGVFAGTSRDYLPSLPPALAKFYLKKMHHSEYVVPSFIEKSASLRVRSHFDFLIIIIIIIIYIIITHGLPTVWEHRTDRRREITLAQTWRDVTLPSHAALNGRLVHTVRRWMNSVVLVPSSCRESSVRRHIIGFDTPAMMSTH